MNKDLREFIASLNSKGVEYLVIGAYAVAWHGWPRFTADIDFLLRISDQNADATVAAIEAFGFGSLGIAREDLNRPDQVLQIGAKPNRIDLITSISAVDFPSAWENKVPGTLDGLPVFFISLDDLIRNKEATGRPKDLGDADELKKRRPTLPK